MDDFSVYRIARTSLRNGHWKTIAAPLLESINEKVVAGPTFNIIFSRPIVKKLKIG